MPFTDYFLAPDDAIAVTALPDGGPLATGLPTVEAKNVDPVVNLGNLEAFLTGVPYDDVVESPRQGEAVGDVSSGEADQVIIAVTDTLRDALASASGDRLDAVAVQLAGTEELEGSEPEAIADFINRLAALAARADGWHLYCYWAL